MKKIISIGILFLSHHCFAITKTAVTMSDGSLQPGTTGFNVSSGTVVNFRSTTTNISSAVITNLSVTNLTDTLASITTLTNTSASITNLTATNAFVTTETWKGFGLLPILQIVGPATDSTTNTTTNTSFEDTGVTLAITPKLNTSKILVIANGQAVTATSSCYLTLARAGTNLFGTGGQIAQVAGVNEQFSLFAYDSPATTSSVTYSIQFKVDAGGTCAMPTNTFGFTPEASILLVEIAQ